MKAEVNLFHERFLGSLSRASIDAAMRKVAIGLALFLALLGGWVFQQLQPPKSARTAADDFVLTDVTVIEPTLSRDPKATLRVVNGRIQRGSERIGGAMAFPDLSHTYVLPGLVDMHAHLPPDTPLKLSGYYSLLFLAHGVTTIRDAGDPDGTAVPAAREGIEDGEFAGPRIVSCGPFVAGAEPRRWPNTEIVDEPQDAERIASALVQAGHSCIKAYEDLSVEKIEALKAAAARHGLRVIGHVPSQLSYEEALIPDVQHFFGVPRAESLKRDHVLNRIADWQDVDDARLELIVQTTLEHGIINTPTLVSSHRLLLYRDYEAAKNDRAVVLLPRIFPDVVWNPVSGIPYWKEIGDFLPSLEEALTKKLDLVVRLYHAGAKVQLGTDTQQPFVVPGASLQEEMLLFVQAGIPLEEVWAMATWKQGQTLMPDLGRLTDGAPADLLVFREDPTQSLEALGTLVAVVARGKLYLRDEVDRTVERYRTHFRGGLVDKISLPIARRKVKQSVLRDY
ncbi:MAG: amidohydrolase family protein [Myxococcales bacterium]|nr:amidohydrolase family protein [Myxococcales bacterium]MDH3483685.1 amidohydrolase family protein [Myxococcales bacterium]